MNRGWVSVDEFAKALFIYPCPGSKNGCQTQDLHGHVAVGIIMGCDVMRFRFYSRNGIREALEAFEAAGTISDAVMSGVLSLPEVAALPDAMDEREKTQLAEPDFLTRIFY